MDESGLRTQQQGFIHVPLPTSERDKCGNEDMFRPTEVDL
jgi:hypothetical protein